MNSGHLKFYLGLLTGLFTMFLAGPPAFAAPAAAPSGPLADWMAPLPATKKISTFSIPGSHDSCALYESWPHTARCQALTISEQLATGVRFLDIRCRHIHDAFKIFHGSVDQKTTFDLVLNDCLAFLKEHPAACLILSVKEESTPEENTRTFEQTFDTYVKTGDTNWFLKDYIPALKEVRGKLVLFRRFSASSVPNGIAASAWPDNAAFWISPTLRVQDDYVVKDKAAKWAAIAALYQEAVTGDHDALYVNFASGYEPGMFGIPDINAVSDSINPQLTAYFQKANAGRYGITLMDFADAEKCALIIGTNLDPDRRQP